MEINCTEIESVYEPRIHCPKCDKDYELIKIEHVCGSVIKCSRDKRRYEERFLLDVSVCIPTADGIKARIPVAKCAVCETMEKNAKKAQFHICPECDYEGYYHVETGSELCPVCVNSAKVAKEKVTTSKKTATDTMTPITTPKPKNKQKTRICIQLEVETLRHIPQNHACIYVRSSQLDNGINGYTEWFLPSDLKVDSGYMGAYWRDNSNLLNFIKENTSDDKRSNICNNLIDSMKELSQNYIVVWKPRSAKEWEHFKFMIMEEHKCSDPDIVNLMNFTY